MDLVTGATGFIGRCLAQHLVHIGQPCRLLARHARGGDDIQVADLADTTALSNACIGVDRVFHCAGYAHAFSSLSSGEDAKQHWRVNFEGTRNLVEAAGRSGVKRFVFLSSVKAMAEPGEVCANEDCLGEPVSAYGQSKRAAEEAVLEAGARYGMHVVNLRLTMVYGSGGHGNLERMGRLVSRGLFPPLPETGNHRSLVHVNDVVAAMCQVVGDDRARGRTYIVAGPQAPSGRQLFDAMRTVLGLPECHWAVPQSALRLAARCGDGLETILKRRLPLDSEALDRLLGSAWYSPARIKEELGWRAKISLEEGLREMFGR
jgi:nucleoside-diphosphate-sugar epimerase